MQLLQPLRNKEAAVLLHNIAYRVRGNSGYLAVPTIGWERSSSEWPGPLRSLGTRPYPINDTACKNSDYIGNFVYKNDTLQYILNSEGRARPILDTFNHTRFVYDYFIKDHLGNVRSTVTAEPMNLAYIASHEIAMAGTEQLIFDNIPNVRDSKPGGGGGDVMAVRLNGGESDKRIGTAIMLHAMPGDRFTVSADAFYEGSYQQSTEEVGSDVIVQSLASALLGGTTYEGVPVSELPDNARLASSILSNPSLPTTLSTLVDQTNNPDAPKAHLNILFFDENMRLIPQASSVTQVTQNNLNNANGWTVLTPTGTGGGPHPGAPGPGYVVIFVDNQSIGKDVWFDNIMVGHYTGTVQEESHYYPFGLTLQTDVQTPEVTKQVYKYQGIELERNFGLETYETFYRGYDPQLGRFNGIDPKPDFNLSPYSGMADNPVSNVDPQGDNPVLIGLIEIAVEASEVAAGAEVIQGGHASAEMAGLGRQVAALRQKKEAEVAAVFIKTAIEAAPAVERFIEKTVAVVNQLSKNYQEASAAAGLPKLKGKTVPHIGKTLTKNGFGLTRRTSTGNETWDHSDGSQVRVHPYGNKQTGSHKSGNNAHVHKQDNEGNQLDDAGNTSTDPDKTHIGTKNPKDLPAVRERPHGS